MLLYLNVARIQVGIKVEQESQKYLEDLGKTQGNTECTPGMVFDSCGFLLVRKGEEIM